VVATDSPGGIWGPWGYVEAPFEENFTEQNGGATGTYNGGYDLPQAEVEWAIAVSPVADVWVDKSFSPSSATPGDTVTITLRFENAGSLPAEDVVLTDTLPAGLVNPTWAYWTSNGLTVTRRTGTTYTWDLPDLAWMEWGLITVTAQVDSSLDWPKESTLSNNAAIGTSTLEQYQVPELLNTDAENLTVYGPDLVITKTLVTSGTLFNGSWVTFAINYSNAGQAIATNVLITDALSANFVNASYSSVGATVNTTGSISYTWRIEDLSPTEGGMITITGVLSSGLSAGQKTDECPGALLKAIFDAMP